MRDDGREKYEMKSECQEDECIEDRVIAGKVEGGDVSVKKGGRIFVCTMEKMLV